MRAWLLLLATGCAAPSFELRTEGPSPQAERRWGEQFRRLAPGWARSRAALEVPFAGIDPPHHVRLLLGRRGGRDAFTEGPDTIVVDLSRWPAAYGDAAAPGSEGRIRRILSHEYTHLLTRAWLRGRDVPLDTPLRRALWECFYEGLGTYRSLTERWLTPAGALTGHARSALDRLGPIFVERMAALARPGSSAEEDRLREGLSTGAFDQKWGALPVALWLAAEGRGDDTRLRPWVSAGPRAVLALARRHLPADLAGRLPPE